MNHASETSTAMVILTYKYRLKVNGVSTASRDGEAFSDHRRRAAADREVRSA